MTYIKILDIFSSFLELQYSLTLSLTDTCSLSFFPFFSLLLPFLSHTPPPYSLLCHVDYSLWSGVAGSGEVVAVSLHADGLQPVLHCAHCRGRLRAPWLQQSGVRPSGWRREKWRIN